MNWFGFFSTVLFLSPHFSAQTYSFNMLKRSSEGEARAVRPSRALAPRFRGNMLAKLSKVIQSHVTYETSQKQTSKCPDWTTVACTRK